MYYLQSRYYAPAIGRFISADSYAVTYGSAAGANMFAYCVNNPVMGSDPTGEFVGTIFDIASLASSVAAVVANPYDPWAWAALAGDVVDVLLPCVSGVGEATKMARTTVRVISNTDDVVDTARVFRNTANAGDEIKKSSGVYVALYKDANGGSVNYIGKGGFNRAITSAQQHMSSSNELKAIIWAPAPNERTAFISEYLLQSVFGVKNHNTYNLIWSPGRNK